MKRRFTRVTAMALAGMVAAGGFTPPPIAHAADTATEYHVPYSEFSQEGGTSRDSTVTWENLGPGISDDTVVIIPKDIPLGRDTKTAEYGITVKGSIPYDRKVTVTPRDEIDTLDGANFYMHDTNPLEALKKADIPATVVQADTEWSVDEVTPEGTVKNGDISAPGLTYGSWEGILTFDINMEATDGSHTHNFVDGNCDKCGMAEDGDNPGGTGNPGTGDGSGGTGDGSGGSGNPSEPGHEHNFVDGVCTECGEKDPNHTHNYQSNGMCTCGEENPDITFVTFSKNMLDIVRDVNSTYNTIYKFEQIEMHAESADELGYTLSAGNCKDCSFSGDGSVVGWIEVTDSANKYGILHIAPAHQETVLRAPSNISKLFWINDNYFGGFTHTWSTSNIKGLSNIDFSNVTNVQNMITSYKNLKIDFTGCNFKCDLSNIGTIGSDNEIILPDGSRYRNSI